MKTDIVSGEIVASKSTSHAGYDLYELIQFRKPDGQIEALRNIHVPSDIGLHLANGNRVSMAIVQDGSIKVCVAARTPSDTFPVNDSVLPIILSQQNQWSSQFILISLLALLATFGIALVIILPLGFWLFGAPKRFLEKARALNVESRLPPP